MKFALIAIAFLFLLVGANAYLYAENFSFEDFNVLSPFAIDQNCNTTRGNINNVTIPVDRGWDCVGTLSTSGASFRADTNSHGVVVGSHTGKLSFGTFSGGNSASLYPTNSNTEWMLENGKQRIFCVNSYMSILAQNCATGTYIFVDGNSPIGFSDASNASKVLFPNSGTNQTRSQRQDCFALTNNTSTTQAIGIMAGSGGTCGTPPAGSFVYLFDNFYSFGPFSITQTNYPAHIDSNTDFNVSVVLQWDDNAALLKDANVKLTITSAVSAKSVFIGSFNVAQNKFIIPIDGNTLLFNGDYNFRIDANWLPEAPNYVTDSATGFFHVAIPESKYLTFTPISNISEWRFGSIEITPTTENDDVVFKIDNNSALNVDANLLIFNSLNDGRQYFIYTADQTGYDNNAWVFDDTLNFGSSSLYNDAIQKIWDENASRYTYYFIDTLSALETKYYKLTFQQPAFYSETLDGNWFNQLPSNSITVGTKNAQQFSVSSYANIFSYKFDALAKLIPDFNESYEIQFTARTDDNTSANLSVSDYDLNSNNQTNAKTVSISDAFHTFSVDYFPQNFDSRVLIKSNETYPKQISIYDVRIISRGYFRKRLNVFDELGQEFPAVLIDGASSQVVSENQKAELVSSVVDKDANIYQINYEAFFDGNATSNLSKKISEVVDNDQQFKIYDIQKIMEGLIDLNNSGPNHSLVYRIEIVDRKGNTIATQSKKFKFLQWPYFPKDLELSLTMFNSLVGENPKGHFSIFSTSPQNVLGVKFYLLDQNTTIANPNYSKTFFNGPDFKCNGDDCSFDFNISDYVYPSANKYVAEMVVLVSTETFQVPFDANLVRLVYLNVNKKQLEAYRVLEIFPRQCYNDSLLGWICDTSIIGGRSFKQYRSYEKIPLILQVRSQTKENLRDNLKPYLSLVKCLNGSACGQQANDPNNYYPDGFSYDDVNGNNYWYFNQSPFTLNDGNFYRVLATVTDTRSQFQIKGNAVLTVKEKSDLVYAPDTNTLSNEYLLQITDTNAVRAPQVLVHYCVSYDQNSFVKSFDDITLACGIFYRLGNSIPDKMSVKIGNSFSDYSETNPAYQQFIQVDLGPDVFEASNMQRLKDIAANVQDNAGCTTIGCLLAQLLFLQETLVFHSSTGTIDRASISDLALSSFLDSNFDQPIDNSTTDLGWIGYVMHGVNVLNVQDFQKLEGIAPSTAVKYAISKNVAFNKTNRPIDIYVNGEKVKTVSTKATLVINQNRNQQSTTSLDQNHAGKTTGSAPLLFSFQDTYDLFYNFELSSIRKIVGVNIRVQSKNTNPDSFEGAAKFLNNLASGIPDFLENPIQWVKDNIVAVVIVLMIIVIFAWIYSNFASGGGNTVYVGR